jgi:hypothetical protein
MNQRMATSQILARIIFFMHRCVRWLGIHLLEDCLVNPRRFSNALLRYYAPLFRGFTINVSGWDDRDGEGGHYQDYFINCSSYAVSNAPVGHKGLGSVSNKNIEEIEIDLLKKIDSGLQKKFDVVFNHTTLEHIFAVEKAFENICQLSCDAVILVVPVMQNIHIKEYGDYWRPTTLGIVKLFLKNGFEPLVVQVNDQPFSPIYCFAVAVKDAKKYEGKIEKKLDFEMGKFLYGSGLKERYINNLLKN